MSQPFEHPLSWATLVDYWAADLDLAAEFAIEEHLMSCELCSQLSARVSALTEILRTVIPPLIHPEMVDQLTARGLRICDNPMQPGERREVVFPADADILLHRLGGLSLERAARVSFAMRVEHSGELLAAVDDAPFDRAAGAVLVACQKHFAVFPPDTVAEIRVREDSGAERVATYTILHRFGASGPR